MSHVSDCIRPMRRMDQYGSAVKVRWFNGETEVKKFYLDSVCRETGKQITIPCTLEKRVLFTNTGLVCRATCNGNRWSYSKQGQFDKQPSRMTRRQMEGFLKRTKATGVSEFLAPIQQEESADA